MPSLENKINLYIAYDEADTEFKEELVEHLSFLRREGLIEIWHKQKIEAGENMEERRKQELDKAQVILLLISSDFVNSDEIYENEVVVSVERHRQERSRVIPVIVRECLWKTGLLSNLSPLPVGGKAVNNWQDRDAAFKNIVSEIQKVIAGFTLQEGELKFEPIIPNNQKSNKITFKKAIVPGLLALVIGFFAVFFGLYFNGPYKSDAIDRDKILEKLQGDWVNPKTTDNFIHRIILRGDTVEVYSLGNNEELYWGGQKLEIINPRKSRVQYNGFSFEIETMMSTYQDTLVESLVAIYSFDTTGIFNIRNSRLYKQETLSLIAMNMKINNPPLPSDTPVYVLNKEKLVNLNELEITPRMLIDNGALTKDTTQTKIRPEVVRDAQLRRAAYLNSFKVQPEINLNTNALSDTGTIKVKDNLFKEVIKPNPESEVKPQIIKRE
ncbi:MAG: toll/interleukin-1 receptor domain-containing protein [Sphingobacteriales bacterium]|nr:MAG: toll/interleukin-1 receptor domain-containing protein [Sphingobacteriales bacterium]